MRPLRVPQSLLALALILLTGACSSSPKYRYEFAAGEARYDAPEGSSGNVRIMALGPADVTSSNIRVMHLRMIINNGDKSEAWVLSMPDERLFLPDQGSNQPAYVDAGEKLGSFSQVTIPPGQVKTVDLYYVLPQRFREADEIPRFAFEWKIRVGKQTLEKITLFDRAPIPKQVAQVDLPLRHRNETIASR
jgi:hypothetical protein